MLFVCLSVHKTTIKCSLHFHFGTLSGYCVPHTYKLLFPSYPQINVTGFKDVSNCSAVTRQYYMPIHNINNIKMRQHTVYDSPQCTFYSCSTLCGTEGHSLCISNVATCPVRLQPSLNSYLNTTKHGV